MSNEYGYFEGTVITEWLRHADDDRLMRLVEDFTFYERLEDGSHRAWTASANRKIDGATIPDSFWTIVGPPFVGDYRRASVIHDIACDDQGPGYSSEEAHLAFYRAMRCDGVGKIKALIMYQAVRRFGPRWGRDDREMMIATVPVAVPTLMQAHQLCEAVQEVVLVLPPDCSVQDVNEALDARESW
jgi:hypothetical protein